MWFSFFFALVSVASALEIESLDRSCNYDEVWKISKLEPGETWWAGIEFTALADDDVQITAYLAGYDGEPLRTTSEMFNVASGVRFVFLGDDCIPVHDADTDCILGVSISELVAYIGLWKDGEATMQDLMDAIVEWKG